MTIPWVRHASAQGITLTRQYHLEVASSNAQAWPEPEFVQEVLAQLPWYHQLTLLDKLKTREDGEWYRLQLPDDLAQYLPSMEQIEAEFQGDE